MVKSVPLPGVYKQAVYTVINMRLHPPGVPGGGEFKTFGILNIRHKYKILKGTHTVRGVRGHLFFVSPPLATLCPPL